MGKKREWREKGKVLGLQRPQGQVVNSRIRKGGHAGITVPFQWVPNIVTFYFIFASNPSGFSVDSGRGGGNTHGDCGAGVRAES